MSQGIDQLDRNALPGHAIAPRSLVLNLTLQCPLKCGHCCYSADMGMQDCIGLDEALRAIDQAAMLDTLRQVQFVGGDPFLKTDLMRECLLHARKLGLSGSATTSAYWARTSARALAVLEPLAQAGLNEIVISYDDAHAEFVPVRNVVNAVNAARALALRLYVAVTIDAHARIDARYLRELLGIAEHHPRETVYEVVVNDTGRATAEHRETRKHDPRVHRGACQSVLQNVQVTHDARVLPCCGVLPHLDSMVIGQLRQGDRVDRALTAAYDDLLWAWIALEGPVQILVETTRDAPDACAAEDFDGICAACERLFSSPDLLRRARIALEDKRAALTAHVAVLQALGLWRAPARDLPSPRRLPITVVP